MVFRLRHPICSRGWGPWLSVATSPGGSYRETDVLNFLDRHLPKMYTGRRWRSMTADDFAPQRPIMPHGFVGRVVILWSRTVAAQRLWGRRQTRT